MSAFQLEVAAELLGPILGEVVFVGGATVHLWLTEPGAPPARATEDVDVICEVATRAEYYRLGERLRGRGLEEVVDEPVLCRWRSAEPRLVLDVMPTDPAILGFSNPVVRGGDRVRREHRARLRIVEPKTGPITPRKSLRVGTGVGTPLRCR